MRVQLHQHILLKVRDSRLKYKNLNKFTLFSKVKNYKTKGIFLFKLSIPLPSNKDLENKSHN